MQRTRFPEFAQFPLDIQVTILDHVHDRRDPSNLNNIEYRFTENYEPHWIQYSGKGSLMLWAELRLVCRQLSQWFSVGAVHKFAGYLGKLASNQLLERMTSLQHLHILSSDYLGVKEVSKENCEKVAAMLPSSLRYLDKCPIELLQVLPRRCKSSLQAINHVLCIASNPRIIQPTKQMVQRYKGLIKHLELFNIGPEINKWRNALCDFDLETLTLEFDRTFDPTAPDVSLPILPVTLKRLNIASLESIDSAWLPPNLEVFNAPGWTLVLSRAMPNLKEVFVYEMYLPGEDLDSDTFRLASYFPNLEIIHDCSSFPVCNSTIFRGLSSLRSLYANMNNDMSFDLADLPQSLEDIYFDINDYGAVHGQPPLMPYLRKLDITVNAFDLSSGAFNNMPVLEKLTLSSDNEKPIELEELLPLCNTLIKLDLTFDWDGNNNPNVLSQFSRLGQLCLSCRSEKPFKLCGLPQTLHTLFLFGNSIECAPMAELPNLKEFYISTYKEIPFPVQSLVNIFSSAPALQLAELKLSNSEMAQVILNGLEGKKFERLLHLDFGITLDYFEAKWAFQLLEVFPNVEHFRIGKIPEDIQNDFLMQLSYFVGSNESGRQMETLGLGSLILQAMHAEPFDRGSESGL